MWKNEADRHSIRVLQADGNNIIRKEKRKEKSMQFFTLNEKLLDRLAQSQRRNRREIQPHSFLIICIMFISLSSLTHSHSVNIHPSAFFLPLVINTFLLFPFHFFMFRGWIGIPQDYVIICEMKNNHKSTLFLFFFFYPFPTRLNKLEPSILSPRSLNCFYRLNDISSIH